MLKYKINREDKVAIFKNMLINNGNVTAYYVLYPYNYNIMDIGSVERHIQRLYNVFSNLYTALGEIKLSMFKLKNIVSKEETINNIIKTVRMYDKDYKDMPVKYKKYIKNITRDFSILAIDIDVKNSFDIESQSLKEIIKKSIDNFVVENFSTSNISINEDVIAGQNIRIKNILSRYAVPANEKLVMNIYINSLFPSYNLIYNDYMLDHADAILSNIKQEIIPKLGWFEMSNSGIADLGGIPRKTYGAILTILEFPEHITSENFIMGVSGLHVNMNMVPKEKALLRFKRMRADANEELEEAAQAQTSDSDIDDDASLAQYAIDQIRRGRIVTDVDANILVLADTLQELDKKKKYIISVLSDINVVASIASNQAKVFIDSFVKNRPSNYYHSMDLTYAISFQLDDGVLVGDQDSRFAAPVIGISY